MNKKSPVVWLVLTSVLFAAYLSGDGFGDAHRGDGTRIFRPGYVAVYLQVSQIPDLFLQPSGWTVVNFTVVLGQALFLTLPILYFRGILAVPWINHVVRCAFLCAGCAYSVLMWGGRFNPPELGAYFWLMGVLTAQECLVCCILLPDSQPADVTAKSVADAP